MSAFIGLCCVAGLLGIAAVGVVAGRWSWGSNVVYGASLLVSLAGLSAARWPLWTEGPADTVYLVVGLRGIGANFRVDALASFFLIVANLGGASESLYA